MKSFLYRSLVSTVAAPIILAGHGMIAAGTVITTGGIVTKLYGQDKAVAWSGASINAKQIEAEKKEAAKATIRAKKEERAIRAHNLRVERLEAELMREQENFRASGMTVEC